MDDGSPGSEVIADSHLVAVRRNPDGSVKVSIKWAMTRWFLLAGFVPGLALGIVLSLIF